MVCAAICGDFVGYCGKEIATNILLNRLAALLVRPNVESLTEGLLFHLYL